MVGFHILGGGKSLQFRQKSHGKNQISSLPQLSGMKLAGWNNRRCTFKKKNRPGLNPAQFLDLMEFGCFFFFGGGRGGGGRGDVFLRVIIMFFSSGKGLWNSSLVMYWCIGYHKQQRVGILEWVYFVVVGYCYSVTLDEAKLLDDFSMKVGHNVCWHVSHQWESKGIL